MKRFVRDGDYWLIVGPMGNEYARFETNSGIIKMLVINYQMALERHGDEAADWFLHGICQAVNHCTIMSMQSGKPLSPYVSPDGPIPPPGEDENG